MDYNVYISRETALLAKKKGFDLELSEYYTNKGVRYSASPPMNHNQLMRKTCSRPTQAVLQRWLREERNIDVFAIPTPSSPKDVKYYDWKVDGVCFKGTVDFESALEHGLIQGLNMLDSIETPVKEEIEPIGYEVRSENLSNVGGGGMDRDRVYDNWRKNFQTLESAKKFAEDDYKKEIKWERKDGGVLCSGDLSYVMYYITPIKFEE